MTVRKNDKTFRSSYLNEQKICSKNKCCFKNAMGITMLFKICDKTPEKTDNHTVFKRAHILTILILKVFLWLFF